IIPVIAVLATHHRSVQNAEAMRISQEQNIFSNYFKHRDEFEKHMSKINPNGWVNFMGDTHIIYDDLFPDAIKGCLLLSDESIELIKSLKKDFLVVSRKFFEIEIEQLICALNEIDILIDRFLIDFGNGIVFKSTVRISYD